MHNEHNKKMKFSNKERQIKIRYYFTYKIDNYKIKSTINSL